MARPSKLSGVQKCAVVLLAAMGGYSKQRVAELLLPFTSYDDINSLRKSVDRIIKRTAFLAAQRKSLPLGTYIVHGVHDINDTSPCKTKHSCLVIMEACTGWVHVRILPRIDTVDIINGIDELIAKARIAGSKAKLPRASVVLMSYYPTRKNASKDEKRRSAPKAEYATAVRKPCSRLIKEMDEAFVNMDLKVGVERVYKTGITPELLVFPEGYSDALQIEGPWRNRPELNERVDEIVSEYNCKERVELCKRTKEITPYSLLRTALRDKQKKNKKDSRGL